MNLKSCTEFLQWALPKLNYRWKGFYKVKKQVCKRVKQRFLELGLKDFSDYKVYLDRNDEEWTVLNSFCYISISRFYRDRWIFDYLKNKILPNLVNDLINKGEEILRCLCIGCCSGEEPYTVSIIWDEYIAPKLKNTCQIEITATDREYSLLERAKIGVYHEGSLKELPYELVEKAFTKKDKLYTLKEQYKEGITFIQQDILTEFPEGKFHIILCRNLVFTYFNKEYQQIVLQKILQRLELNGFFIIGNNENLPVIPEILTTDENLKGLYKRIGR